MYKTPNFGLPLYRSSFLRFRTLICRQNLHSFVFSMPLFRFLDLFILSLLAISPVVSASTGSPAVLSAGPTVTIASGVIVGKTTTVSNQPSVTAQGRAYLGVPFAQSPPERFSPPVAASAWLSPLQAQDIKPACIQQFSGSFLLFFITDSLTNLLRNRILPSRDEKAFQQSRQSNTCRK